MTGKDIIGLYFMKEAIGDLKPDPQDPRILHASLGGGSYFGCIGAARAIQDSGDTHIKSCFLGPLSRDYFGQLARRDFEAAGVKLDYAPATDHISMLALVSQTPDGRNMFDFYGRNKPNTTEDMTREDLPADLDEKARLFCFGSVVMTLSPSREVMSAYAKEQYDAGHIIYFDPNTRPSIIPDRQHYVDRMLDMAKNVSVLRASEEDIEWTFPDLSFSEAAKLFLDAGVMAVIITKGAKGCSLFIQGEQETFIESETSDAIVNTVGAGDNFNAGIILALARAEVVKNEQLATLGLAQWKDIAAQGNNVAYKHLCRQNRVA